MSLHDCPHCSKQIEVVGKVVRKPGAKNNSHRALGDALFTQVLGLQPDNRAAISAAHRRYGRAVKDILGATGSVEKGLLAAKEIRGWAERQGLTWTLDTVAKHCLPWLTERKTYAPTTQANFYRKKDPICADLDCRVPVKADGDYCPACAAARE